LTCPEKWVGALDHEVLRSLVSRSLLSAFGVHAVPNRDSRWTDAIDVWLSSLAMSDSVVEILQKCVSGVYDQMQQVGRAARYLWGDGELWSGYSYVIPKEEQVRSALYRELSEYFALETEWTLYEKGFRGHVRACGEVDLVGFRRDPEVSEGPSLLLEIKRAWWLKNWVNKVGEMAAAIERDAERLCEIKNTLASVRVMPMAGVLIASFRDDDVSDPLSKVCGREVLQDWKPLYAWERERGDFTELKVRFDLIRV